MTTAVTLSVRKFLEKLAITKDSGCLKINGKFISWNVYIQEGTIKYVDRCDRHLDQFKYYLHCLKLKPALKAVSELPGLSNQEGKPDFYGRSILWLLSKNYLDLPQATKLIEYINQDLLIECLWIEQGVSDWLEDYSVPAWMPPELHSALSLNVTDCLRAEEAILHQWQKCSAELTSVHQRPYLALGWQEKELPSSGSLNKKILLELSKVLRGSTSIRQLSMLLRKDELSVGKILSPYIDSKTICLRTPKAPLKHLPSIPRFEDSPTVVLDLPSDLKKIVCVDDSPTILSEIKRFLDEEKFAVTAIDDPIKAASSIFKIKPDLIENFSQSKLLIYDLDTNKYLKRIVKNNKLAEVIITERNGLNVGYSSPTSDFVQRDESWWKKALVQKYAVEPSELDKSANTEVIPISQEIKDPDTGVFLGIIKTGFSTEFAKKISNPILQIA